MEYYENLLNIRKDGKFVSIPAIKGDDGYSPIRGVDYFTDEDIETMEQNVAKRIDLTEIKENVENITNEIEDIKLFKFPNTTIIGQPLIESGQVSRFTTADYMMLPFIVDVRDKSLEAEICFTTGSNVTAQQNILDSEFGLALAIQNGKGIMALSSNGTTWDIGLATGNVAIQPNTTYYAKIIWDKSVYKTSLSTDGINFIDDMVLNSTKGLFPRTIYIGGSYGLFGENSAHVFGGSINLNKCYINIANLRVWSGMDDAGLSTRADVSLKNLDAEGEKRFSDLRNGIESNTGEISQLSELIEKKYEKPETGIPKSHLSEGARISMNKADTAYQKPETGIPKTDLSNDVQEKLDAVVYLNKDLSTLRSEAVKSINGIKPDANGNVVVEGASAVDQIARDEVSRLSESILQISNGLNSIANIGSGGFVYSKNLLNENDADYMTGYRASNSTGNPTADTAWNLTGFIPVESGKNYIITSGGVNSWTAPKERANRTNTSRIYAYREDKSFIDATYNTGIQYYAPSSECAFIRVAVSSIAAFTHWMIENSTEITEYEEWHEPTPKPSSAEIKPEVVKDVPLSKQNNDAGFVTAEDIPDGAYKAPLALPNTLYAFANVPVSMYFYNIMDYSPSDIYLRLTNSNKGKMKARKWEYTPSNAENVQLKFNIMNHDYKMLNENEIFNLIVKNASIKSSLKCLVIGDSTVQAGQETQKMLDLANADGYSLTLLGTRGVVGNPNQHEGRGGWTAKMYVNNASNTSGSVTNAFYNPSIQKFDFTYYMNQQGYTGVDCVFIQLGINDLFTAKTDAELETLWNDYYPNINYMINSIKAYNSNIKIVLNTIFPCDTDQDAFADVYGMVQTVWRNHHNVYLSNIKTIATYKDVSNVYVSPFCMAIDCDNNMTGDVHPNADGYAELGTQMYGYMRAIN